jgi:acid phosphatase
MTTLVPREPYTADELHRLYPKELALQQVQVVSRSRAQLPIRFVYTYLAQLLRHG